MTTDGSDNRFRAIRLIERADPSTPPSGEGNLFLDNTDGLLKWIDDAGVVTPVLSAAGAMATDALWDAAGDLAVGSGANTGARLALGAAGGALSRVNGVVAWNSGTSNPTGEAGDRRWRTDLGMEFYYDGTRWLCTCPHEQAVATQHTLLTMSATNSVRAPAPLNLTPTIWLTHLVTGMYVLTTNDGSNYWTIGFSGATYSTAALAASTVHYGATAIGAVFTIATTKWIQVDITKVGSPGVAYPLASVGFRYIAP